ncbi:MAG TPA: clostripain-related cysteine peptidase, partial [Elusimicrobiales bacterium]|nr:clostripain-related cysteine peptidase [Elusimicrobiales bacterium]
MKKNLVLLCAFSVLAPARLHAGFDLASMNSSDPAISGGEAPAAPAAPDAPAPKEWTIMVFMNGKSNIESFAVRDLNRIETSGSSDRVNIVAELGRSRGLDGDTEEDGDWTGVRRYLVTKDQDPGRIASPVLMDLGAADMGDHREVASFVKWAKAEFPAKRYMLIIWDHGWGWIDPISPAA